MGRLITNIILCCLMIAVIFIGIAVVNSNDRLYFSNQKVLQEIELIKSELKNGPVVVEYKKDELKKDAANVANVEFFDRNARFGGKLVRAISADTQNMNAIINNDLTAAEFNSLCSSSLAERNYENPEIFQPMMAESWSISDDGKSYLIKLRKNMKWQGFKDVESGEYIPPKEVTAEDFKFYIDVIRDEDVHAAPLRTYYHDLEEIKILNDYEFLVKWKNRSYGTLESTLSMSPLPKHFYVKAGEKFSGTKFNNDSERNRMIISCGPYKFVRWDKDSKVIFEANDDYWGIDYGIAPPIKGLVFELIKHPNSRFQALLSGKLGQLGLTPDQWVQRSESEEFKKAKLQKYKLLSQSYFYIGYNLKNELFQDKKVRQALTMLVDRERIVRDIFRNEAEIITGPFFKNSKYYDNNIKPYPFDIEKAKQLLAEAGWRDSDGDGILDKDGKKFEFTILAVSSHPIQEKMLPIIKEDMAKAAVDMKIQTIEWSVYLQKLQKREFEVCTLGWSVPYESDPYQLWHSSQADLLNSSNHIGFKNKQADELIEKLRRTFDIKERIRLAHEFHQLIHDEQPYTFLVAPYSLGAVSERYGNLRIFSNSVPSIIWYEKY